MLLIVRLLRTDENVSGVIRNREVCSIGGGLCSAFCSIFTMFEILLAEMIFEAIKVKKS